MEPAGATSVFLFALLTAVVTGLGAVPFAFANNETHLDSLNNGLVSVVRETMQPAHVTLWLGPVPPPREGEGPEQLRS